MTLLEVKPHVRSEYPKRSLTRRWSTSSLDWLRQLKERCIADRGAIAVPVPSFRVDAEVLGDASYEAVLQNLEDAHLPDVVDRDQLVPTRPLEVIDAAGSSVTPSVGVSICSVRYETIRARRFGRASLAAGSRHSARRASTRSHSSTSTAASRFSARCFRTLNMSASRPATCGP